MVINNISWLKADDMMCVTSITKLGILHHVSLSSEYFRRVAGVTFLHMECHESGEEEFRTTRAEWLGGAKNSEF